MEEANNPQVKKIPRDRRRLYQQAASAEPTISIENENQITAAVSNTGSNISNDIKVSEIQEKDWKKLDFEAKKIIRKYTFVSAAPNLIPLPFVDLVGQSVILYKMIKEITELYGHKSQDKIIKNLITAVSGGIACEIGGNRILYSFFKYIPFVGVGLGLTSGILFNGAVTYALGKALIDHFETGKNLFNIDLSEFKKKFSAFLNEAKADFIGA